MDGAKVAEAQSALLEQPPRRGRSSKSGTWLWWMKQGLGTLHGMVRRALADTSSVGGDGVCQKLYRSLHPSTFIESTMSMGAERRLDSDLMWETADCHSTLSRL